MIVFNIHAIIQLIVIFLALMVGQLVCWPFGFDLIDAMDGNETNTLIFVAIIAMYTDIKGLKGRLFWIPIWVIAILFLLFVHNSSHWHSNVSYGNLIVLSLLVIYVAFSWLHYSNRFNRAKLALDALQEQNHNSNPTEYWNLVAGAFYQPPFLFLKAYSLWKIMREPVFSGQDFREHYGRMLSLPAFREITLEPYDEWIRELKIKMESNADFGNYRDPERDLKRIAQIIDRTQSKLPVEQEGELTSNQ